MECFVMEDDHEPKPWFSKAAIHDEYNMMRPIMFVVVCVKIIKACYGPFFKKRTVTSFDYFNTHYNKHDRSHHVVFVMYCGLGEPGFWFMVVFHHEALHGGVVQGHSLYLDAPWNT